MGNILSQLYGKNNQYGCFCEHCEQKCCRLFGQLMILGLQAIVLPLKKSPAKRRGNAHQALSEAWVGGENAPDIYIIVTHTPNL